MLQRLAKRLVGRSCPWCDEHLRLNVGPYVTTAVCPSCGYSRFQGNASDWLG